MMDLNIKALSHDGRIGYARETNDVSHMKNE